NPKYFGTGRGMYVMWNLENSLHNLHYVDLTLDSYDVSKIDERQFHIITLVNYTSDQFSGFKNIVVTGTLRDSLVVLEGLLNQETGLHPKELMTDTASYSDVMFGLFHLLGYQFSPRLADIGEARFWRIDASADYGALNGLARQTINRNLITENWDDLLRVAGSLKLGTVNVTELLRALQGNGH